MKESKNYWYLLFLYVVIVVFQILYTKFHPQFRLSQGINDIVSFNKENYDEVSTFLQKDLTERVSLFTSGKMKTA